MTLKVAAVQMQSGPSKDDNVAAAVAMIEEAAGQGADLVALPEYFTYLGPEERYGEVAETVDGETLTHLADLAARHRILIHAGSLVEPSPLPGKFSNTSVLIDRAGDGTASTARCTSSTSTSPMRSPTRSRRLSLRGRS